MNEINVEKNQTIRIEQESQDHADGQLDDREKLLSIILSYLQEVFSTEKLARRYVNIVYNETTSLDIFKNEEYVISKVYDLLHNDSLSLILEDILPFSFADKVQVISNFSEISSIDISTKLHSDIVATEKDLFLESKKKVSTTNNNNNDDAAYSISQDDEHSVAKCLYEFSSFDSPLPNKVSSSATFLYELSPLDSPLPNKRKKTFHEHEQRKRNISLKIRRLHELQHAAKCTHDYINNCSQSCPISKHCIEMKRLWDHMETCQNNTCQYIHCNSSRNILTHFKTCTYRKCPICSTFRSQIAEHIPPDKHTPIEILQSDTHSLSSISSVATIPAVTIKHPFHMNQCVEIGEGSNHEYSPLSMTHVNKFKKSSSCPLPQIKENLDGKI